VWQQAPRVGQVGLTCAVEIEVDDAPAGLDEHAGGGVLARNGSHYVVATRLHSRRSDLAGISSISAREPAK
jgi:hypothetical protein